MITAFSVSLIGFSFYIFMILFAGPKPNSHDEIDRLTKELVDTVEQRNALVELLEEDRLR